MNYVTTSAILKWRGTAGNYWGGSGILIMRSGRAPLKGDPPGFAGRMPVAVAMFEKKKIKNKKKKKTPTCSNPRKKIPGYVRWCSHKCWVWMDIWKWVFYFSRATQWNENEVSEKQNKKGHKLTNEFVLSLEHIKASCLQMSRSWKKKKTNKNNLFSTDYSRLINDQCQDLKLTISLQKHKTKRLKEIFAFFFLSWQWLEISRHQQHVAHRYKFDFTLKLLNFHNDLTAGDCFCYIYQHLIEFV